eukprot:NODE_1690_length_1846_cov_30.068485_g1434_i0.p1 GENE.NODE_1690_length_1846_cov_30.068485_g1434_i0~~NODE_1690_length_1846_cov_30.068485_g1434_i0.p1  ORF type:complete len:379 (+),score=47.22 NODE_1690_length_1846_cov_30.068485_g1434_i0:78-1214(+)
MFKIKGVMDPHALYRTLEGTFNPDSSIRQEAERQLKEAESYPGYMGIIFQVSCANEVNADIRLAAAIRMKNKLKPKDWNADDSPVQQQEKDLIKGSLLSAIVNSPSKVSKVLVECYRLILTYDYPEKWPNLVEVLAQGLKGDNLTNITGALLCLRVLCKRFEFRPSGEDRKPLSNIVNATFPTLLQLFCHLNSQQNLPAEGALMQKLLCKTFWSSTSMELPPLFYSNPAHLGQWLDCFLFVLAFPVPIQDPTSPFWKVKKWIGHISRNIFQRYGDEKKGKKKQLGAELIQNYAAKYQDAWLGLIDLHRNRQYVAPQVLTLGLSFLDTSMEYQITYERLYPHLDSLIQQVLTPLMAFNDSDAELWKDNPQEVFRIRSIV